MPEHIPLETWANFVAFLESDKRKVRTKRGTENQVNNKMCHYRGTKTFTRVRAEEEEKGNTTEKLIVWLKTMHQRKLQNLMMLQLVQRKQLKMSYLALKKIHVMVLVEMKFSKKLLEKTSMVMLRSLALGSKFLVQLLKGVC